MNDALMIAVTTGCIAALGNIIVTAIGNSRTTIKIGFDIKRLGEKFDELEKKVEKHNNLVEKTYNLQSQMDVANTEIDGIREDIAELRSKC